MTNNHTRSGGRGVVAIATMAAAVAISTAGTASAAAATDNEGPQRIYTLAHSGFCAGAVDVGVGHYPSSSVLYVVGGLHGVGKCTLDVTFYYKNRATGVVTGFTRHFTGPGSIGTSRDIVSPGIGTFDITVRTNGPNLGAAHLTTVVEQYHG